MKSSNVLLITNSHSEYIGTVRDHVNGLMSIPEAKVVKVDCSWAEYLDLECFDAVMLHYSLVIAMNSYVSPRLRQKLAKFDGLTILFIQDEYRWIDATAAAIRDLKVNVVFSVVHPSEVRKVYHHPWLDSVEFEYTLTGFVPEHLADIPVPAYEDRPIDIGYRARKLPGWYGRHSEQKYLIAEKSLADPRFSHLKLDIATSEASRLYGNAWIRFISNCKAMLGTESGASVCDFTGEIQKAVEQHIARDPTVSDETLRKLYFDDVDGRVTIAAISPRVFEAAALRTLMIMYPGQYSDVLQAGRHYVELKPDHSNLDEVLAILESPEKARQIVDAAYTEIVKSGRWGHKAFAEHVSRAIRRHVPEGRRRDLPIAQLRLYLALARVRSFPKHAILSVAPLAMKAATSIASSAAALPRPVRAVVYPSLRAGWRASRHLAKRMVVPRD